MKSITVQELKQKRNKKEKINLLDVREAKELSIASIHGAIHIPMIEIPNRIHELDKEKPIAVMCHEGVRSSQVCMYLDQFGFDAYNIEGGIHAWSLEIDPSVKTY